MSGQTDYKGFVPPSPTSWDDTLLIPNRAIAQSLTLSSPSVASINGLAVGKGIPINRSDYLSIWKRFSNHYRPLDGARNLGQRIKATLMMYLPPNSMMLQGIRPQKFIKAPQPLPVPPHTGD